MIIDSEQRGDVLVLTVRDTRIDSSGSVAFKERMRVLLQGSAGRVMLDLSTIEFLDSSGLGALVAIMKMLGGRRLELANCGPVVCKVLALTRMDKVFVLHESVPLAERGGRDAA